MRCPSCQSMNPQGARFCAVCGTALVMPRLIEGERKVATVLFADVANSTSLAETIDPEALGKSRLAMELRKRAAELGLRWLEGRGLSYAQAVLYYPWRQAILASLGARESDLPTAVRTKLEHEVCRCCRRPGGDLPFLEAVLAVESEASLRTLADLEGDALIARIADATQGYFCSLAQQQPTVLAFDDLHWADPATLELLFALAETTRQYPLLLMCLCAPISAHRAGRL
jgi:class 3 adenylate cyclase